MPTMKPIAVADLIWAYSRGIFPMAETRDGEAAWFSADPRAILPLDRFRVSSSLRKRIKRGDYQVRIDTAFEQVIRRCSLPRPGHPQTWINEQIIDVFCRAHRQGLAHSVEAWGVPRADDSRLNQSEAAIDDAAKTPGASKLSQPTPDEAAMLDSADSHPRNASEPQLLGGLYGLALGGAFFGESMFSCATDASKVCLVHLVHRLIERGFVLLDVQMNSNHMAQFGTIDISHTQYLKRLKPALKVNASW